MLGFLVESHIIVFNLMFQDGNTALSIACQQGNADAVELLLKHNINVNEKTKVGMYVMLKFHSMIFLSRLYS